MCLGSVNVILTPEEVLFRGLVLVGFEPKRQKSVQHKKNLSRFRTHFSSDPSVYSVLLIKLQETKNEKANLSFDSEVDPRIHRIGVDGMLKYFFMSIYFLACYPTEEQAEGLFGCSDRTWRNWVWEIVEKIALLKPEIIVWPKKWNNPDNPEDPESATIFIITVDAPTAALRSQPMKHSLKTPSTTLTSSSLQLTIMKLPCPSLKTGAFGWQALTLLGRLISQSSATS
ncbi:hypothetical protein SEMRO_76_G041480.1 [Seminavis robusta]|uniref:Uncharacterized protein n=1 Tax=Seminavis robusta TaxID=568900 RepID=A0A9N8H2Y6_9STRA|nr:hypothetical protein SEMRO_76_G041480.1 [Seminavis robusta]|eukprot:Sro76_g041480.1 n/a (228) ;mRNA; f:6271-6954